jgi:methylenetetrahydrofolate dehydrogenase (NADP+)/methenyltetrahydrofolate cyclohydrolase
MAEIIDGKKIARAVRDEVAGDVARFRERTGVIPSLAVVLVGDNPASLTYVGNKERGAREVGIDSVVHRLSADIPENEIIELVERLNRDPLVHGLLVQLPLPQGVNARRVIDNVSPDKDVDGITPQNFGRLLASRAPLEPCTPTGIMELLRRHGVAISGKSAVVVGRSDIVGKPIALMLMREHATVTICHTRTTDLARRVADADILVAAAGRPRMIEGAWIKEGAVVIDVGTTRAADGKLVGDVCFDEALARASFITPVPGGVGPMTIAMLLKNTLTAAELAIL